VPQVVQPKELVTKSWADATAHLVGRVRTYQSTRHRFSSAYSGTACGATRKMHFSFVCSAPFAERADHNISLLMPVDMLMPLLKLSSY
jgi:hypothetical protein